MATKAQKEYAESYLQEHPVVPCIYLNSKGEWFTDKDYADHSVALSEKGKQKIEVFKQASKPEKKQASDKVSEDENENLNTDNNENDV